MRSRLRETALGAYRRLLKRELADGPTPDHVAVIQDGNRRYARERGHDDTTQGHRAGAETTEQVLRWCADLGIEELTLYAFSTENFERPPEERETLFDLIETKLRDFADNDEVHDRGVCIRAVGETHRLPVRVRDAIEYAERKTRANDRFDLNVALAYGGRAELLGAARDVARAVERGDLAPEDIDAEALKTRLYDPPGRAVDLIVRTGGDERTSNFLPWHANGNEAAVAFCTPYWPEFSEIDFLRAIRTYQAREESWQRSRAQRALALVRGLGADAPEAQRVAERLRGHDSLPADTASGLEEESQARTT